MRHGYLLLLTAALVLAACARPESLVMRPATSPEGWSGSAFYRNNIIASEEFSTMEHGPEIDVWRFYDKYGRLYTEERDTTGNGVRNLYRSYNKDGELVLQKEDTNGDGVYDRTTDYTRNNIEKGPRVHDVNVTENDQRIRRRTGQSCPVPAPRRETRRETVAPAAGPAARPSQRSLDRQAALTETPDTHPDTHPVVTPDNTADYPETTAPAHPAPVRRDNYIRPVPMPAGGYGEGANANSRVVPGPVFHHPSDGLED